MITEAEEVVIAVRNTINDLPKEQYQACHELARHIRKSMLYYGEPMATLAVTLIGAEIQFELERLESEEIHKSDTAV